MANSPAVVGAVEPGKVPVSTGKMPPGLSGRTGKPGSVAGRTFADVLKKSVARGAVAGTARLLRLKDGRKAEKTPEDTGRGDGFRVKSGTRNTRRSVGNITESSPAVSDRAKRRSIDDDTGFRSPAAEQTFTSPAHVDRRIAADVRTSAKSPSKVLPDGPKTRTADTLPSAGLSGRAPRVEIVDLRVRADSFVAKTPSRTPPNHKVSHDTGSRKPVRTETLPDSSATGRTFGIAESGIDIDVPDGLKSPAESRSAAMELSRRLDAEAGNDIVRQVKVVLDRADAGEVRISLRPEHLGRVRIQIQLEDNRLTGRIFVESSAARDAFRAALDGLQTRLVESGFGAADLELTWDRGGESGNGKGNSGSGERDVRSALDDFETMTGSVTPSFGGDALVNVLV